MAKVSKQVTEELTPKVEEAPKEALSEFKLKDKFFDKEKTYIDRKTKEQKSFDADWRKLHIGGQFMILFKGKALTKAQLSAFDKEAKDYWLDKI